MTLCKGIVKAKRKVNEQLINSRALNLLLEDMEVWFPVPDNDVKAMIQEETKGYKASRKLKR